MKKLTLFILPFILCATTNAQINEDSSHILDSVMVSTMLKRNSFLSNNEGIAVYAGKKTNKVNPDDDLANLAQNNARVAMARIPGLTIWEMDGAGTQLNIGSRGTDAHRSIEMNMRQNGYNTNSDMFGYPENHYTLPLQAVEEIQLVRGSAALQFGSQFGGMMNEIIKSGDSTKPLAIESEQTTGANNFFNSYNAVGGTKGKLNYYAYYDYRRGDGWRDNAAFTYHAYYANLTYNFSDKGSIAVQFSRMNYVQQIAGGLTDAEFAADNQQSLRARNFFNPFINIPAIIFNYRFSSNTHLQITNHFLFGERNSVQYINTPDIKDTFNTAIDSYNPRQLDRDYYKSFTTEARLLHQYKTGNTISTLSAGVRFSSTATRRKQRGVGTTGNDFDLTLIKPYGVDLHLHTNNYAAFAENIFTIGKHLTVTPGVRYEVIKSDMYGVITNATIPVNYKSTTTFPLFGTGIQYETGRNTQLYGNISQAYRPYLYANITPATQVDVIDPNLKNSKGYDADLGWRGKVGDRLNFDVNLFCLYYGNKVGLLSETTSDSSTYLLTTNIGNSVAKGFESYAELFVIKAPQQGIALSVFNSLAYNDARYTSAAINKSGVNTSIKGNRVENAPEWIEKAGVNFQYHVLSAAVQYTYTSKSYNDALNTESSANGVTGALPAWHVLDVMANWNITSRFKLSAGINNVTNEKYFNRRITFYPGPGILPADGRTYYVSFGVKL